MNNTPCRVTADLRDKEARQDAQEAICTRNEEQAKQVLRDKLFRSKAPLNEPCIDTLLEMFFDAPGDYIDEWQLFREVSAKKNDESMGALIVFALENCSGVYINEHPELVDQISYELEEK